MNELESRTAWALWASAYGMEGLYDSIIANCQGARGTCRQCGERIYFDIVEGGGVPDWRTADGDYGCSDSPDTTDEGVGGHLPVTERDEMH